MKFSLLPRMLACSPEWELWDSTVILCSIWYRFSSLTVPFVVFKPLIRVSTFITKPQHTRLQLCPVRTLVLCSGILFSLQCLDEVQLSGGQVFKKEWKDFFLFSFFFLNMWNLQHCRTANLDKEWNCHWSTTISWKKKNKPSASSVSLQCIQTDAKG